MGPGEVASDHARALTLAPGQRRLWPTADGAPATDFSIGDERVVALSGDWESDGPRVLPLLRRLRAVAPEVRTILHVGDLRWEPPMRLGNDRVYRHDDFLPRLETQLRALGLRLLLTPGNHDDWASLSGAFAARPGMPRRLSPSMWALPRGCRFSIGGIRFVSFGGAVSVDRDRGPAEVPSDEDVAAASAGGATDVLLTHEPPNVGIAEVDALLQDESRWDALRLGLSADDRRRIDRLLEAVRPRLVVHGHMHVSGRRRRSGLDAVALALIGSPHNTVLLRLPSLHVEHLPDSTPHWAGP